MIGVPVSPFFEFFFPFLLHFFHFICFFFMVSCIRFMFHDHILIFFYLFPFLCDIVSSQSPSGIVLFLILFSNFLILIPLASLIVSLLHPLYLLFYFLSFPSLSALLYSILSPPSLFPFPIHFRIAASSLCSPLSAITHVAV